MLKGVDASVDILIDLALSEDIGAGDVTSQYFVAEGKQARAFVVAREEGILSGIDVAERVLKKIDDSLSVRVLLQNGSRVARGALVMEIRGNARSILTAERTVLNFLQRLGGVATLTRKDAVEPWPTPTHASLTPARRRQAGAGSKRAVLHGGGTNHRMGLYDRVLVKDNHLMTEGRAEALQASICLWKAECPEVEVNEADNLKQVAEFLCLNGVDHILLDNMALGDMREAVALRGGRTNLSPD